MDKPTELVRNPPQAVAQVLYLCKTRGYADYIGEPVPQLAHMRLAATLADVAGAAAGGQHPNADFPLQLRRWEEDARLASPWAGSTTLKCWR